MHIKVSEATPLQLDWLVAKCEWHREEGTWEGRYIAEYSTDWSQGGPIIFREGISTTTEHGCHGVQKWMASVYSETFDERVIEFDDSPLIVAMRCYVASKLGDVVEIPEELK